MNKGKLQEPVTFEGSSLVHNCSLVGTLHGGLEVGLPLFLCLLLLSDLLKYDLIITLSSDCITFLLAHCIPKSRPSLPLLYSLSRIEVLQDRIPYVKRQEGRHIL